MIVLPTKNAILKQILTKRLTARKREACDFNFCDFESITYKVQTPVEDKNIVFVTMKVPFWAEIKDAGAQEAVKTHYGKYVEGDVAAGDIKLKISLDDYKDEKAIEEISEHLSNIKNNVICEVFTKYFSGLKSQAPIKERRAIHLRDDTTIFISSGQDRVYVTFALTFYEKTDRLLAHVFLQEFVETKRKMGSAPICSFSTTPPKVLGEIDLKELSDHSFLCIALLESHVSTEEKISKAAEAMLGFRQFLTYHVKSSKSYFHQRMRAQVSSMLQILNRARLEKEKPRSKKGSSR